MTELDEHALNEAAWGFVDTAVSLGTPIPPPLWNNLKQHLRAAIETYNKEIGRDELLQKPAAKSRIMMVKWEQSVSAGVRLVAASRLLHAAQEHKERHHIRWYVDQALRAIHGKHYPEYIEDFEQEIGPYDEGTPPQDPDTIMSELGLHELFARQRGAFTLARHP